MLSKRLEIDQENPRGDFYYDIRGSEPQSRLGPQSTFELFHWLGLMPDNNLLSNALINVVGEHIFEILYQKGDYKSRFSFLKGKRTQAAGILDAHEQKILWYSWRLIAKLRALQEIDYLFNQTHFSDELFERRISAAKNNLRDLYTQEDSHESKQLESALNTLFNNLKYSRSLHARNAVLQKWQQNHFRLLFKNFRKQQGEISAAQHHLLPKENSANTLITAEATNILQNWEFGETSLVSDDMLYRNDPGMVFHSALYPDTNKRRLLFATQLGEQFGCDLGIRFETLSSLERFNQKDPKGFLLYQARDDFDKAKKEIARTTINIKKELKKSKDKPQALESESRMMADWWNLWKTANECNREIESAFKGIKFTTSLNPHRPKETIKNSISPTNTLSAAVKSGAALLTRPAHINYIYSPGDIATSSLRFLYDFVGYFDQMMEKHPFIGTTTFAIPYLQFGSIGLALSGHNSLLWLANFLAETESKLLAGKITAAEINYVISVVDEAILWFTMAESSLQVLLTCGFTVSKVAYTVFDVAINNWCNKLDETTLTELAKKLDPSGSLEGYTTIDKARNHVTDVLSGILLLVLAGGFGVGAAYSQAEILEFLAHVPVDAALHPSIQTLGAVKTSGLLLGKIAGVSNYMNKENLTDINGTRLTLGSTSAKILGWFTLLSENLITLDPDEITTPAYKSVRRHFERLLQLNPGLISFFNMESLKKLGVKEIKSRWYHTLPVAFIKSIFYAAMFAPALLLVMGYALNQKTIPPMLKLCVAVPFNWLVLTGKLAWNTGKGVIHGFLQMGIRAPEVAIQCAFVALRLGLGVIGGAAVLAGSVIAGVGMLFGQSWCKNIPKYLSHFFFTQILSGLTDMQIACVSAIRIHFRYTVENLLGDFLKACRDVLVRIPEQWLQQAFEPAHHQKAGEALSGTAIIQDAIQLYVKSRQAVAPIPESTITYGEGNTSPKSESSEGSKSLQIEGLETPSSLEPGESHSYTYR